MDHSIYIFILTVTVNKVNITCTLVYSYYTIISHTYAAMLLVLSRYCLLFWVDIF